MDFGLTEEQQLLRQTAKDFVDRVCPPEKAKQWDEEEILPAELLQGFVDLGWFSLPFPEDEGGDGGGPMELVLIAEELGRASFDIAMTYIGVLIPGLTVFRWGTPEIKAWVRDNVMTGRHRLAVAISEPDTRVGRRGVADHRRRQGRPLPRSTGRRCGAPAAGSRTRPSRCTCARAIASRSTRASAWCWSTRRPTGVEIRRMPTLARHILGTTEIFLVDVAVPKDRLVGAEGDGWGVMLSNLELEKVLISGGYLGAAQATLDEMLEYSRTRHAFGRPIGEFQSLAHAMADLQTEIDSARLLDLPGGLVAGPGAALLPGGRDGQAQGLGDLRGGGPARHAGPAPATGSRRRAS